MDKIVKKKSDGSNRRVSKTETIIFWMNIVIPIIILTKTIVKQDPDIKAYLMSAFMLATSAYIYNHKKKRESAVNNWGKSMLDNLEEAIHNATYLARLTNTLLIWYLLGIGIISVGFLWIEERPWWVVLLTALLFAFMIYLGRWEQRCFHEHKRDELIRLKQKLVSPE